jgi:acetoacetyl-CoA synthetase
LLSMSGGTDVVSVFATGAPNVPTWPGEISCAALGVALDTFDGDGSTVRDAVGELVITEPMPTMPVFLWNDPDGRKYRAAYFEEIPGVWKHGDWATITSRNTIIIHGRSDATLNRQGIRIGSADIYAVVEAVAGIREALVVGLDLPDSNYWMPLFVVLAEDLKLDEALKATLKSRLRDEASPRHVPDEIFEVPAIPHTRTGKKLEIPVKRLLLGESLEKVVSVDAIENPSAFDFFVGLAASRRLVRTPVPGHGQL